MGVPEGPQPIQVLGCSRYGQGKKNSQTLPKYCSSALHGEGLWLSEKGLPDGAWMRLCQTLQLK